MRALGLKRWVRQWIQVGVDSSQSDREQRQTRTANQIGLGFVGLSLPYVALFVTAKAWTLAVALTLACVGYASAVPLNLRRHRHWAKIVPLVSANLIVSFVSDALGPNVNLHIFAFMLTGWAFNLFDVRRSPRTLLLLVTTPGLSYFAVDQIPQSLLPTLELAPWAQRWMALGIPATAYGVFTWVLWVFYRANQNTENQLVENLCRLRDEVAERKCAHARAESARNMAERAGRARSEFLAVISHELKTPLNGVVGSTDLLSATELSHEQRDLIDIVQQSGAHLLATLSNILDFAALDAGRVHLEAKTIELRSIFEHMTKSFVPAASKKGLGLTLSLADDLPRWVHTDEKRVTQIVGNLVDNAIKFTEHGSVQIKVRCDHQDAKTHRLRVEVHDTGIGVRRDRRETIFEYFSQGDGGLSRSHDGAGLGLTISRFLAKAMNGDVTLLEGTTVGNAFALEVLVDAAQGVETNDSRCPEKLCQPAKRTKRKGPTRSFVGARVLVAEDNLVNQKVILSMLKKLGIVGTAFSNGKLTAQAFSEGAWDIVLMDIQMPVMDGLEATTLIRKLEVDRGVPPIPIVAVTANSAPDDVTRGFEVGITEYVGKPVKIVTLESVLAKYLPSHVVELEPTQARR